MTIIITHTKKALFGTWDETIFQLDFDFDDECEFDVEQYNNFINEFKQSIKSVKGIKNMEKPLEHECFTPYCGNSIRYYTIGDVMPIIDKCLEYCRLNQRIIFK